MRKRIYRISEDKFDDPKPNIELSDDSLNLYFYEGEAVSGSFTVTSTNKVAMRGMVYVSVPYITVANSQFEGETVDITFEMDNYHFKPDESIEGAFTIVVYGSEITLPFKFTCKKKALIASTGVIDSLEAFAKLYQSHMAEAMKLFYSEEFSLFISSFDKRTRLLYKGISKSAISPANIDEFLVACNLKETMTFDMNESPISYFSVDSNIKGELEIARSSWGYIDIKVRSDNDFVTLEKENIVSDNFLGSIFTMNYYIHRDRMHKGRNFAKISFDYRDTHKEIVIMASTEGETGLIEKPIYERDMLIYKLSRTYEDFRLRKITTGKWTTDSIEMLDALLGYGFDENWILLYKTQLYITNKQKQEALWIIQDLKRTIPNKHGVQWAYLLYLCTLIEREESYVDRLTADIEAIFKDNQSELHIFWFLLFLRKEYVKNPTAKLRAIAAWVKAGYNTPFLFIEAYYVFIQDPYLIASFDEFTLKILGWAQKRGAITKDIAIQMIHVLETERAYNPKAFKFLEACYEIYPDKKLLLSMVTYLLKSQRFGPETFKWYKLAIDSNLHIAGIFEAYMNTVDTKSVQKLPQVVTLFFKYTNNLSYDKKALLYANIIMHKDEENSPYKEYERTIEKFALEQLKLGHMDDNLAVCYQLLLSIGLIDKDTAELLAQTIFLKKVVPAKDNIRRVLLYQEEFTNPKIVSIMDGVAYLPYFGKEGQILLEDYDGCIITSDDAYELKDMMDIEGNLSKIRSLVPSAMPFLMHSFMDKTKSYQFTLDDIDQITQFVNSPEISADCKIKMYPILIEFLQLHNKEEVLEQHLLKDADLSAMPETTVALILDLFVARERFEEAYYLLNHLNSTKAKNDTLMRICHHMIKLKDRGEDFLISLAAMLTDRGETTDTMISYLLKYYVGPSDLLIKIYNKAYKMGVDCVEFAERILILSMYIDQMPADIMSVFDTYIGRKTNKMVVEAFLTFEAHYYLTTGDIPEQIFSYIYTRMKKGYGYNESMRIALMKFLCEGEDLTDEEVDILDQLVGDSVTRNQYFGFFSKMDMRLQIKYHFYDKCFVEFKGDHRQQIIIAYSINGSEPVEDEMIEMYDGLYVKQFLLFFGDNLRYEIYCDEISELPLTSAQTTVSDDVVQVSKEGRFAIMNDMNRMLIYGENEDLIRTMKRYQGLEEVTKEIFTTI